MGKSMDKTKYMGKSTINDHGYLFLMGWSEDLPSKMAMTK